MFTAKAQRFKCAAVLFCAHNLLKFFEEYTVNNFQHFYMKNFTLWISI